MQELQQVAANVSTQIISVSGERTTNPTTEVFPIAFQWKATQKRYLFYHLFLKCPNPGRVSLTTRFQCLCVLTEKSRNSNFSVQMQIGPKFQFEFVPRDNEESEFRDPEDVGNVAFSMETVIFTANNLQDRTRKTEKHTNEMAV